MKMAGWKELSQRHGCPHVSNGGAGEFSAEQLEVLTTLNAVFSVLSFLGSSFIIFMFLKVKTLRSFAFQLVPN